MARAVVALFALVILLVGGTVALQGALETAGTDRVVINETFTPGSGGVVQLDNSNINGDVAALNNPYTITRYNANGVYCAVCSGNPAINGLIAYSPASATLISNNPRTNTTPVCSWMLSVIVPQVRIRL